MSNVINVKVKVNYHKIRGKLYELFRDEQLRLSINQALYKRCNPYVPMQSGVLAQGSVEITPEYVRYNTPYAHYQYEGILYLTEDGRAWARAGERKYPTDRMLVHSKEVHPKATRHWDKAMMAEKGEQFTKEVERLIIRRAKQLYG